MCVFVCVCVCVCLCECSCECLCGYLCECLCVCLCVCVCMCVCVCLCMLCVCVVRTCMRVSVCLSVYQVRRKRVYASVRVSMLICASTHALCNILNTWLLAGQQMSHCVYGSLVYVVNACLKEHNQ